jgi:hypothetical protein
VAAAETFRRQTANSLGAKRSALRLNYFRVKAKALVGARCSTKSARALAAHGAQVVGAARDLAKAKRATAEVRAQAANGGGLELV